MESNIRTLEKYVYSTRKESNPPKYRMWPWKWANTGTRKGFQEAPYVWWEMDSFIIISCPKRVWEHNFNFCFIIHLTNFPWVIFLCV